AVMSPFSLITTRGPLRLGLFTTVCLLPRLLSGGMRMMSPLGFIGMPSPIFGVVLTSRLLCLGDCCGRRVGLGPVPRRALLGGAPLRWLIVRNCLLPRLPLGPNRRPGSLGPTALAMTR